MKEKIFIFIIGLLLGAILASGAFLIYTKTSNGNLNPQMNQPGDPPPEKPDENSQANIEGATIPENPTKNNQNN